MFLFLRNAIFLDFFKSYMTIEWQLDHLDKFTHGKHYIEVGYDIINLEGEFLYYIKIYNLHHLLLKNKHLKYPLLL